MRAHLIWKNNEKFLAFGFAIRHKEMANSFFDKKRRRIKIAITVILSLLFHALVFWLINILTPKADFLRPPTSSWCLSGRLNRKARSRRKAGDAT